MQRTVLTIAVGSVTAILLLGALGGCTATVTGGTSASKSKPDAGSLAHPSTTAQPKTPTASASPTPSGPPPLPANALFQISATVKASSNGATADLIQTVYTPVAQNPTDAALLDSQCNFGGSDDWRQAHPNSIFLDTTLVATLQPGSPAFLPDDQVDFQYSSGANAYSGDWAPFEAPCASQFIKIPGKIHGVATVPSSDPVHGFEGWAESNGAYYGFWAGGNQPGTPDSGGTAVVSNCVIQLSAAAIAAGPVVAAWATQPFTVTNGCVYSS
jgi:hypothetical protein